MAADGVDVLLLSVGADLPYFCGYEAMPLERLTMLVVPRDGDATLVVPALEAPRVLERPDVFSIRPWTESQDPIALVSTLMGPASTAAIGDHMWSGFLVDLIAAASRHRLPPGVDDHQPDPVGQGRRRDRPPSGRGRRRRPDRGAPPGRRDPADRPDRGRGVGRARAARSSTRVTTG